MRNTGRKILLAAALMLAPVQAVAEGSPYTQGPHKSIEEKLTYAAMICNVEMALDLLNKNDVDLKGDFGGGLLYTAARQTCPDVSLLLIDRGANWEWESPAGDTARTVTADWWNKMRDGNIHAQKKARELKAVLDSIVAHGGRKTAVVIAAEKEEAARKAQEAGVHAEGEDAPRLPSGPPD